MKKLIYASILLFSAQMLQAQPVMTDLLNFTIGDTLHYKQVDTAGFNPGAAGANVTWDFSNMKFKRWLNIYIIHPNSASNGGLFPNATYVEALASGDEVYVKNDASYTVEGVVQAGVVIQYPDARKVLTRPITYNDTFKDGYTTKYSVQTYNLEGAGNSTTIVDGYGQLITPDDTFDNVLRVKATFTQSDTVKGLVPLVANSIGTSYYWFDSAHKEPLMRVEEIDITSPLQNARVYVVAYIDTNPPAADVEDVTSSSAKVNAVINDRNLLLSGDLITGKEYSLALYSQNGQAIVNTKFVANSNVLITSLPELPSGIYVLTLTKQGSRPQVIKVIK